MYHLLTAGAILSMFSVVVIARPYRSAQGIVARPYRSTQGVLHTRQSLNEFLTTYLQAAQQRAEPQYGYPEYQPTYQQGYISHRPRRAQNLEPLMQYLNSPNIRQEDYPSYDMSMSDLYQDNNQGEWYDEPSSNIAGYAPQNYANFLDSETTQQDLALAQLMLDHIAGKYSLEDLETLEREARLEENSENQLRALTKKAHRKKSVVLPYNSGHGSRRMSMSHSASGSSNSNRGASDNIVTMRQRLGQKEEPVMVPATSIRRPIFMQQLEQQQQAPETHDMNKKASLASTTVTATHSTSTPQSVSSHHPSAIPRSSGIVEVVKVDKPAQDSVAPSTMAPYVHSAYEAFKKYLDTQRQEKINADQELVHSPKKRFVQEADPLPQELNSLKKSVV